MKKIPLTGLELSELKAVYEAELERTQKRIVHLKGILKKMEGIELSSTPDFEFVAKSEPEQNKLGRKPKAEKVEVVKTPGKRGPKPKVKAGAETADQDAVEKVPARRGRKPKLTRKPIKKGKGKKKVKWNDFIIQTLESKDYLMLSTSLTAAALDRFGIQDAERNRVRMAISTTLTKMANTDKSVVAYSKQGIRGSFFGLPQWFNEEGSLKEEYANKLM
ncbi:MAG: hypothetical protein JW783_10505 [Bacteroidales bacterium]|nr:hypothetical protein [Bacteroidales bacterium]MBN2749765.1 hypothetical protein [Bacteroidales bacterium]